MKIAIDGMGGDNAPAEIVSGVIKAMEEFKDIEFYITGPEDAIKKEIAKNNYSGNNIIIIIDSKEVITTNEHPVMAVRRKKDSSLCKALNLVKEGTCDAVISAGSTGAFLAGCTFIVGRIKGIKRPALAPVMPGKNGSFIIVDAGANVDSKPEYLVQFAHMGKEYYKGVLNGENPSVGLVNIGEEAEKGNDLTKETFKLLSEEKLNFIGNIEPRDITKGDVNVIVCDGFAGNTILKMYEGTASTIMKVIKEEVMASGIVSKIGAVLLKPVFNNIAKRFDYKEYGGAPFLGVDGICIKAHGSSDARAFKSAIKQAKMFYDNKVLDKIKENI